MAHYSASSAFPLSRNVNRKINNECKGKCSVFTEKDDNRIYSVRVRDLITIFDYELHDSIEQPARSFAQSGRF